MKVKNLITPVVEEIGKFAETAKEQVRPDASAQNSQAQTSELVKDIYKPDQEISPQDILKKQAEDKKQRLQLRQALHQEYVQSTLNRPKPKEEPKAEKMERQKMEDLQEKKKKEEKKVPINVQRAQNVEKFRGSSG